MEKKVQTSVVCLGIVSVRPVLGSRNVSWVLVTGDAGEPAVLIKALLGRFMEMLHGLHHTRKVRGEA